MWDIQTLSLDARPQHYLDPIHPTHEYVRTWLHMLAHHDIVAKAIKRRGGKTIEELTRDRALNTKVQEAEAAKRRADRETRKTAHAAFFERMKQYDKKY